MKASYKIALIVSVVVCILAVVVFKGQHPSEQTQTADDASITTDLTDSRKTLRSDTPGDGSLKSMVNAKPATTSPKAPNSILSDARNRILAANASDKGSPSAAAGQASPRSDIQNTPAVLTIGGKKKTSGISLARTQAGPTKTTTPPRPTTKVTRQALDSVFASPGTTDSTRPGKAKQASTTKTTSNVSPTKPGHGGSDTAKTYTVQPGDLLSTIAVKLYDDESRWVDIAQANPRVEPTRLRVGQVLRLPGARQTLSKEEHAPPGPGALQTYTVQAGDSLSTVAEKYYGDPTLWRTIYNHNRKIIGDNPNAIKANMTLEIPPRLSGAQ